MTPSEKLGAIKDWAKSYRTFMLAAAEKYRKMGNRPHMVDRSMGKVAAIDNILDELERVK